MLLQTRMQSRCNQIPIVNKDLLYICCTACISRAPLTFRKPLQQVLSYISHIHTKTRDAQNHDSRYDTTVPVLEALYFMLHHHFAMQLSAAAESRPAELQLLDCNSALDDDIGHQADVC